MNYVAAGDELDFHGGRQSFSQSIRLIQNLFVFIELFGALHVKALQFLFELSFLESNRLSCQGERNVRSTKAPAIFFRRSRQKTKKLGTGKRILI